MDKVYVIMTPNMADFADATTEQLQTYKQLMCADIALATTLKQMGYAFLDPNKYAKYPDDFHNVSVVDINHKTVSLVAGKDVPKLLEAGITPCHNKDDVRKVLDTAVGALNTADLARSAQNIRSGGMDDLLGRIRDVLRGADNVRVVSLREMFAQNEDKPKVVH